MTQPLVEVLTFAGCPNAQSALDLVNRVVDELGAEAYVVQIDIPDLEAAAAHRFLGSPTIRVNGRDVEHGADERGAVSLSCRVYRTARGVTGEPDERWLRDALRGAAH